MSTKLSNADQTYLSPEQQAQIKKYKADYAAASVIADPDLRKAAQEAAHKGAEEIRAKAAYGGYSAGSSGTGYEKLAANQGGQSAEEVEAWKNAYNAAGYDPKRGWVNGYDVDTNTRSKDNYIRQQMEANSKAWHGASAEDRAYLHDQNEKLALLLSAESIYDKNTGQWGTYNTNSGYGRNLGFDMPNVNKSLKQAYGYTDQDMDRWDADTSRYYNFVDTRVPARNQVDESSGFTGRYAQFALGPYAGLLSGSNPAYTNMALYSDLIGDGFNDENDYSTGSLPDYDENGNIIKKAPALKGNNDMSDYTKQFAAYTQNGIIMPNSLQLTNPGNAKANRDAYLGAVRQTGGGNLEDNMSDYTPNTNDGNKMEQQLAYKRLIQANTGLTPNGVSRGAAAGGGNGSYIEQMYDAALKSQLSGLETSYNQNVSDLDASAKKTADQYREQRRQYTGQTAQDAAAWREMANAYGLNTGAIGQAALAQNNQLQSGLGDLQVAESATLDEIERNRVLLGQQYQAAINEAVANNDFQKAQALYQEAVRVEQQLIAQQQFAAQMGLQYAQMAMQQNQWAAEFGAQQQAAAARAGGSGGGNANQVVMTPEALGTGAYYRQVAEDAAANGQTVTDYLNSGNYKKYNIPYNQLNNYVTAAQGMADTYDYVGNTPEEVYTALSNRLSNSAVFGNRKQQLDLISQYQQNGLLTNDMAAKLILNYGLVG